METAAPVAQTRSSWFKTFVKREYPVTPLDPDKPYFSSYTPFFFLAVLSLIGIFATGFLSYRHILLAGQSATVGDSFLCRAGSLVNCDGILISEYSMILDYFPSPFLGLVGFAFTAWITISAIFNERIRKLAWILLVLYFGTAIGFTLYYVYVMIYLVEYICTWCIVVHAINFVSLIFVLVVAFKKKKEFLLPEIGTRAEKTYFVIGGLLLPLLVYAGAGYWEKSLSFTDVKTKYEDLANDPVVIMAQLKHSATFNIPIAKDDPIYGDPNAQFSIILFSDFQCPICAKTEQFLKLIVDMNRRDLNLVYKNYPLSNECNSFLLGSLHPDACKAARAGYAAFLLSGPEGFWRYGDLLFSNQNTLKSERWLEFARSTGLDQAGFQGLMQPDSPAMEKVRRDIQQGVDLKISSTPMVYFKGKNIPQTFKGDYLVDALEELIRMNHPELKDFQLRRR